MNQVQEIFVFGSNLAGRHGAGAALIAVQQHGAVHGIGVGRANRSYAIPTKDCAIQTLPRTIIALYVQQFHQYAGIHWLYETPVKFKVTRIGCGLAGFKDQEIAPMFGDCPPNCEFDLVWMPWLGNLHRYWGTYDGNHP